MLSSIVKALKAAPRIALFHHVNPDCDAISSSYGLLLALRRRFPRKHIVWVANKEYLQTHFAFLPINYERDTVASIDSSFIAVIGDTASWKRIDLAEEFAKAHYKICFDHHRANIDFPADLYWSEPSWTASAMQAIAIAERCHAPLDAHSAFFLAIGLLTDSNNFAYSLADPLPVEMYSRLLHHIPDDLLDAFFNDLRRRTKADIELLREILSLVQYSCYVSYVVITKGLVVKYGKEAVKAKIHAIGNITNYPVWIMFIEKLEPDDEGNAWEVHFRSNGPAVNEIASRWNGGGHVRASGAKIKNFKNINEVLQTTDDAVAQVKE